MKPTKNQSRRSGCVCVEENGCHAREAEGRPHRTDKQERLAAELVDEAHADQRRNQVNCTDDHGLLIARNAAEACRR